MIISSVSSKISDEERKDPVVDPDVLIIEQVRRSGLDKFIIIRYAWKKYLSPKPEKLSMIKTSLFKNLR
jgi:hypothetical protein